MNKHDRQDPPEAGIGPELDDGVVFASRVGTVIAGWVRCWIERGTLTFEQIA
jgi:hypothetical protein